MKDDWLTIPDAPNYEINSQLICRNKKSGYILKPQKDKHGNPYYSTRTIDKKIYCRSPKLLYRCAKAASVKEKYIPIPSLNNRYEINSSGSVRNVRTKQILKKCGEGKCVKVRPTCNGKSITICVADLLWEVHGIIKKRKFRPVPVSCENENGKFFFDNLRDCARFLAPKIYLSWRSIANGYLNKRKGEFHGWKITYLNDDINHNDYALANAKTPSEVYR